MDMVFIFGAKYLFLFSILGVLWYFWVSTQETRKKLVVFLILSLPLTYLVGVGARALYFNPRPFVVENFEPLVSHTADNGFPSDHLLLLGALSAAMLFFDRRISSWLWGIAVFVAVSRVYVGIHHFLDVGASIAIALLCAILVKTLWKHKNQTNF